MSHAVAADLRNCYPEVATERIHVIHNAVDPDDYRADGSAAVLDRHGIDPDAPIALFVGRVTRQKGIGHLLAAADHLDPAVQVVIRAGAPDTPELGREIAAAIDGAKSFGAGSRGSKRPSNDRNWQPC